MHNELGLKSLLSRPCTFLRYNNKLQKCNKNEANKLQQPLVKTMLFAMDKVNLRLFVVIQRRINVVLKAFYGIVKSIFYA